MNANCDAPVKTSSDIAIACARAEAGGVASAPNDTANVPTARPIAVASRTTVSWKTVGSMVGARMWRYDTAPGVAGDCDV